MIHGVDVSVYQPSPINWEVMRDLATVQYAFCRATCGMTPDLKLNTHAAGIKAAGIALGAYHFAYPLSPVADQVSAFCGAVDGIGITVPVLDIEATTAMPIAARTDWCVSWLEEVEKRLGLRPLIYTGLHYANTYLESKRLSAWDLWLAMYPSSSNMPPIAMPRPPKGWAEVAIWQWIGDDGRVPGYDHPIDRNICTLETYQRLFGTKGPLNQVDSGWSPQFSASTVFDFVPPGEGT